MEKKRLKRLDMLYVSNPVYFVTLCTANRQEILANPSVHNAWRSFCTKAPERGAYVGQYVIMPDHIHLFVRLRSEVMTLSNWIKSLKNFLSKTLRESGYQAPHWQKGFFDHILRSVESYSEKWFYVSHNPIRAGLCSSVAAWPFQGQIGVIEVNDVLRG